MIKVIVKSEKFSYPINISFGLLNNPRCFYPLTSNDNVVLITDSNVASIYLNLVSNKLKQNNIYANKIILNKSGEENKSITVLNDILTILISKNYTKNIVIVALGGGVIGDISGFIASIYKRGVRFIQIPTTLISQVDAAIGGKTAINHYLCKNIIGSLYSPLSVIIDLNFLNTLSYREISSGLAEVIKYGIAIDKLFFLWLEEHIDSLLLLKPEAIEYCVKHCCKLKASIVSIDKRETNDKRILLNLGHTYGHAIESYTGYKNLSHGEAISLGIMMAVHTACRICQFDSESANRIKNLFHRAKLPTNITFKIEINKYISYMLRDKKNISNNICLVLPIKIGQAKVFNNIKYDTIVSSIKDVIN